MKRDTVNGTLLIASSLSFVLVMMHHPTGHGIAAGGGHMAHVNVLVHSLALAMTPVMFLGLLGAARRLAPSELAVAAMVGFGFGAVAVMGAAMASGFVATDVMLGKIGGDEHALMEYTHAWNQAFARVYVVADSIAIVLLSLAILRTGRIGRLAGVLGLLVGAGILAALTFGVALDVQGFGMMTFARAAWMIVLGVMLARGASETRATA